MKCILVTNNSLVHEEIGYKFNGKNLESIIYLEEASFLEVLEFVRNKVHAGHELLTHPLTGSVKPYETPFKSIIISAKTGSLDFNSLKIIEDSIEVTKKFLNDFEQRELTAKIVDDFKLIDYNLIVSGLESINQFQ